MIITIKVECLPHPYLEHKFRRDIELEENMTLDKLHLLIQQVIYFNGDHTYSFFIANTPYSREKIKYCDQILSNNKRCRSIDKTKIKDIFPLAPKKTFFYQFDDGDGWFFTIKKSRNKAKELEKGVEYPRVVKYIGGAF